MTSAPMAIAALTLLVAGPLAAVLPQDGAGFQPAIGALEAGDLSSLLKTLPAWQLNEAAPLRSESLGLRAPAAELVDAYEARAAADPTPLRTAVQAWDEALGLDAPLPADQLAASDALPHDVQVAVAVVLAAMTDATLAQRAALSHLDAKEYNRLLSVANEPDPVDAKSGDALARVVRQVDQGTLASAGQLVATAVQRELPVLQAWSQQEPAPESLRPLLATGQDPLDALVLALSAAGQLRGIEPSSFGLVEPSGSLADLVQDLAAVQGVVPAEQALARLDQLPAPLKEALAGLLANYPVGQAADAEAQLGAAIRLAKAVQRWGPTLEAWGLVWRHHGAALPVLERDTDAYLAAFAPKAMGWPQALQAANDLDGRPAAAPEPWPKPKPGQLDDALAAFYESHGAQASAAQMRQVRGTADQLPAAVEQNAARVLFAQAAVGQDLAAAWESLAPAERQALADAPSPQDLLSRPVTAAEAAALRSAYAASDKLSEAAVLGAARLAATIDAAVADLEDPVPVPAEAEPAKRPSWVVGLWRTLDVIPSARAQAAPSEPPLGANCPSSAPLADCAHDVWFRDPVLGTVVITGSGSTTFDRALLDGPAQALTIDLGGNDVYRNNAGGAVLAFPRSGPSPALPPAAVAVAIDLAGDDRFEAAESTALQPVQGAALGGIGILWDRRGNDNYAANTQAQGYGGGLRGPSAPCGANDCVTPFAVGLLVDGAGNDAYVAKTLAQGAGATLDDRDCQFNDIREGLGCMSVVTDSRFPLGGLGILADLAGNDQYRFTGDPAVGQGAGHHAGTGVLVDAGGDDSYVGGSQGQGDSYLAAGLLFDAAGKDGYSRQPAAIHHDESCWASVRTPRGDPLDAPDGPFYGEAGQPKPFVAGGPGLFVDLGMNGCAPQTGSIAPEGLDPATLQRDGDGDLWTDALENAAQTDPDDADDHPVGLPPPRNACDEADLPEQACAVADVPPEQSVLPQGAAYVVRVGGVLALADAVDTLHPAGSVGDQGRDYLALIDLGGNDTYLNRVGGAAAAGAGTLPPLALDVGDGGDAYVSGEACVQGCDSLLLDLGGDDAYQSTHRGTAAAPSLSQGAVGPSGVGLGLLFDASGNDTYRATAGAADEHAQAAVLATPQAIALLLDAAGNDTYAGPGQATVDALDLAANLGGSSVALFADLGGADLYQPAEVQGVARFAAAGCNGTCRSGDVAAFLDAGGWDRYVGSRATPGGPDRSATSNNRVVTHHRSLIQPTESLFIDQDGSARAKADNAGSPGGVAFPGVGVIIGTGLADLHTADVALLIDPGGDDSYRNNAGGTLLRGLRQQDASGTASFPYRDNTVALDPDRNFPVAAVLLDLAGDDVYQARDDSQPLLPTTSPTSSTPNLGSGLGTFSGNAVLASPPSAIGTFVQGAALLGTSILVDLAGSDSYRARGFSQGAAVLGTALLWDRLGDDTYSIDTTTAAAPAMRSGVVAWQEFQDGQWRVKAGRPGAPACLLTPVETQGAGTRPAIHVDGNTATVVFSVDDPTRGVTRLRQAVFAVPDQGGSCPSSGQTMLAVTAQASNQVGAQITPEWIVWQDDRLGDADLFFRARGANSGAINDRVLVAERGSRQADPSVGGGAVAWQDDRTGMWQVHSVDLQGGAGPVLLSRAVPGEVREDTNPSISAAFAAWETRVRKADGTWKDRDVAVLNRLLPTGPDNPRVLALPGDQSAPDVAGAVVLFSDAASSSIWRYDWEANQSTPERPHAGSAAIDRGQPSSYAWVATEGTAPTAARPAGAPYHEVLSGQLGRPAAIAISRVGDRAENRVLQGAAWLGGLGLLLEESGHDRFLAGLHSQGAAFSTGTPNPSMNRAGPQTSESGAHGILANLDGNDAFTADRYSQGSHIGADTRLQPPPAIGVPIYFEATQNFGLLASLRGSNRYAANGQSQGYAELGLGALAIGVAAGGGASPDPRAYPLASIGALADLGGRDAYLGLRANEWSASLGGVCGEVPQAPTPELSGPVAAVLAACIAAADASAPPVDEDRIWFQGGRRTPNEPVSSRPCSAGGVPCFLAVGGVGLDLSLMDRADGPAATAGGNAVQVSLAAYNADAPAAALTELAGRVQLCASATKQEQLDVSSVELYLSGTNGELFVGYGRTATIGGKQQYCSLLDTTDLATPDGAYTARARVNFGAQSAPTTSLGFSQATRDYAIDNPPRLLQASLSERFFSPAPFAAQSPQPPTVGFAVSQEPGTPNGHGWAQVRVLAGGAVVATPRPLQPVAADGLVEATWDGTADDGTILAPGTYTFEILAVDRLSSGLPAAGRSDVDTLDVRLDSLPPAHACVRVPKQASSPCNGVLSINTGNSRGAVSASVGLQVDVQTSSELRRVHLFTQPVTQPPSPWTRQTLDDLDTTTEIEIPQGQTVRVLALVEDASGNLECHPACTGRVTSTAIPADDALRAAALDAARDRKAALGVFGDGERTSALFTVDIERPVILIDTKPLLNVNGRLYGLDDDVRAGPESSVLVEFAVEKGLASNPPSAVLDWVSLDAASSLYQRRDTIGPLPRPGGAGTFPFAWGDAASESWPALVNGTLPWPEGIVTLAIDAFDAAGNRPLDTFQQPIRLDRTAPLIEASAALYCTSLQPIDCPEGKRHANLPHDGATEGVVLEVKASDPAVQGVSICKEDIRIELDASPLVKDAQLQPLLQALEAYKAAHADDPACRNSCRDVPLLYFCYNAQSDLFVARVPVDPAGHESSRAATVLLPLRVTDSVGNLRRGADGQLPVVPVVVGAPQLGIVHAATQPLVGGANVTWTTVEPASGRLLYGTDPDHLDHVAGGAGLATEHTFELAGLRPGTTYFHRFEGTAPNGAIETFAGEAPSFRVLHGVRARIASPEPGAALAGIIPLDVRVGIDTTQQQPLVQVLLRDDDTGVTRPLWDAVATDGRVQLDLVTETLAEGNYTLLATASFDGELNRSEVARLVIDNTPPALQALAPAEGATLRAAPGRLVVRAHDARSGPEPSSLRLQANGAEQGAVARFVPDLDGPGGIYLADDPMPAANGPQQWVLRATDRAGNVASMVLRFRVDTQAPANASVALVYPAGQQAVRPGQTVHLFAQADDDAGLQPPVADLRAVHGPQEVQLVATAGGYATDVPIPEDTPDLDATLRVWFKDRAGNLQARDAIVTVDGTPPRIVAIDGSGHGSRAIVDVHATEPVRVKATLAGHANQTDAYAKDTRVRLAGAQPDADLTVLVAVTDRAGHVATGQATFRTAAAAVPDTPVSGLKAVAGASGIRLEWAGAEGAAYIVHRSEGGVFVAIATTREPAFLDAAVQPGTEYQYFVQANDDAGTLASATEVAKAVAVGMQSVEVAVAPSTGVAGKTPFRFEATVRQAAQRDAMAWLVLNNETYRMQRIAGDDCRDVCTFAFTSTLPALDLRTAASGYHVEVADGSGAMVRSPPAASPDVLVDAAPGEQAPAFAGWALCAALLGLALLRRRLA